MLSLDTFLFSTGSAPPGHEVIAYFLAHFSDRSGVANDLLEELELFSRSASQPAELRPAPSMMITKKFNSPESGPLIRSAARRCHRGDTCSLQRFPSCKIPAISQTLGREDKSGVAMALPPRVFTCCKTSSRPGEAQSLWSGCNSFHTFRLSICINLIFT